MQEKIVINIYIERKNIKNMYLKIKPDGVHVTANYLIPKSKIEDFISKNDEFIKKSYAKIMKKEEKKQDFYYLGKRYNVIVTNLVNKIEFYDDRVFVKDKNYLNTFLKNECVRVFNERLKICYDLFEEDIPYPVLGIRKMTRKWGYCNKRDRLIKLNSELIKYSINEIDYVIIHELSHLIEFNHSKNFWKIVKKYKPDYKKACEVLKEE